MSEAAVHSGDGDTMAIASDAAASAWQATAPISVVAERRSAAVETVHSAPAPPSMIAAYPP